jgi:transposase
MTSTTHLEQSSAAALYVAVELSTEEWLLTMATAPGGRRQRARIGAGDRAAYERVVAGAKQRLGVPRGAAVRSCYEAGRDGFWPHRFLTALGVTNLVVDSSSIEVPRRARRAKTDRLDGEKLLRLLLRHWGGERQMWQVVHVPAREAEDARHASRGLTTWQVERTRYRNRIRGLLALHGVRRVRIDGHVPARVATLTDWAGAALPAGVQARVLALWRVLQWRPSSDRRGRRNASTCEPRRRPRSASCACAGSRPAARRFSAMSSSGADCGIVAKLAR